MYICQWHLDIIFGKQRDAVEVLKAWKQEDLASSEFRRAKSIRMVCGHVGPSPSHLILEHEFETLADWEAALADMAKPQFKRFPEALAPFVVAGSQHWEVLRILG